MLTSMTTIASRLRELREAKGMTQSELARAVGMTPQAINLLESGTSKAPTPQNLFAIADALGVSARELALGRQEAKPDPDRDLANIINSLATEPHQEVLDFLQYKIERTGALGTQEKMASYLTMIDKIKEDRLKKD
jgi:transcriptional regulator with XRE-family HTH domain